MRGLWRVAAGTWATVRVRSKWLCLPVACLCGIGLGGWLVWQALFGDLPSPAALHRQTAAPSSKIFDRYGRLLYEIMDPHSGNHSPVPLEDIPLALRQATVATEDVSFYHNPGVDARAILRAVLINIQGGEVLAGGSTITQQLARNLLLSPEERGRRTLLRKLRESILAYRLARSYTKDDILELYLNETYYGNMAYGVEAAARTYFGKPVSDLDLAECALLAGLPQAPAVHDPLVDPEAGRRRQAVVLDLMVRAGFIDAEEADLAKAERLHFAATPFPIRAPHFVMYVRRLLEEEFGLEMLYRGGLRVHTTLDLDMQRTAERIVRRRLAVLNERQEDDPVRNVRNAALVVLDPRTGEILAMLGSPDYFDPRIDGAVNVALATRQPGSSIKPFTYALAFSKDYTPATMLLDVRTSFTTREGEPYVPYNYDRRFRGPVLLREALASSFNLIAVRVLDHVGLEDMIDFTRQFGITTFDDSERFGLSLTLGGGEVRLLELTGAYAAFANAGHRVEPAAITLVEDVGGNVLKKRQLGLGPQILDPRVAYLVTDILSDDQARVPGFGVGSVLSLSRPAAVKTGTTTDWRDNWTVGYTPEMVVGVWVGNADNEPMGHVSGVTGAAPIWHDFVEEVLKGRPVWHFVEPAGLAHVEVCAESGMLPTVNCIHRKTEVFLEEKVPTAACTLHQRFRIDRDTGRLATENTPSERVVERVFTVLPSEAWEWAREHHVSQPPLEWLSARPHVEVSGEVQVAAVRIRASDDAAAEADAPGLFLVQPSQGSTFRISPQIPADSQCIEVSARPGDQVYFRSVRLFVDEVLLGEYAAPPYRSFWCLEPGAHVFEARGIDQVGREVVSQQVSIVVH